jgi:hypothetical protein
MSEHPERVTQYFGHGPKVTAVDYILASVHERVVEEYVKEVAFVAEERNSLVAEVEDLRHINSRLDNDEIARLRADWHEDRLDRDAIIADLRAQLAAVRAEASMHERTRENLLARLSAAECATCAAHERARELGLVAKDSPCPTCGNLEGGNPPEGSRLWRCEKSLREARAQLAAVTDALRAAAEQDVHAAQCARDALRSMGEDWT